MATTQSNSEVTEFPPSGPVDVDFSARGRGLREPGESDHWLRSPNPSLEGKTPLEAAQTDQGYQEVEDVLVRIEHGVLG